MRYFNDYIIAPIVMIIICAILYVFLYVLAPAMLEEQGKIKRYQVNCTHQWQVAGTDKYSLYKVCTKCDKYIRIK